MTRSNHKLISMTAETHSLSFDWPPKNYSQYHIDIYINDKLTYAKVISGNSYTVQNLKEGDSVFLIVRGYRGKSKLKVLEHTPTQNVPIRNSNSLQINSFIVNGQEYLMNYDSVNQIYSGSYNCQETESVLTLNVQNSTSNDYIFEVYKDPFIQKSYYNISNYKIQSKNIDLSTFDIPIFNLTDALSYINVTIEDVHSNISSARLELIPYVPSVNQISLYWRNDLEDHSQLTAKLNDGNFPYNFSYYLSESKDFINCQYSGQAYNSFSTPLDYNKDYYLKVDTQSSDGEGANQFIYPHAIRQNKFKPILENSSTLKSILVDQLKSGQLSISTSTSKDSNFESIIRISIDRNPSTAFSSDSLCIKESNNDFKKFIYNYTQDYQISDHYYVTVHLVDKDTQKILGQKQKYCHIQAPKINQLNIDFNYKEGYHTLNVTSFSSLDLWSGYEIMYKEKQSDKFQPYHENQVKKYSKYAEYDVKIQSKHSNFVLDETSIQARAIKPHIVVTDKSNIYFNNKAVFHLANMSLKKDSISYVDVYRGPIPIFVSGFISGSGLNPEPMENLKFNIFPSKKFFYTRTDIGDDFIDVANADTKPQSLHHTNYQEGGKEYNYSYYSGQSYQAIFVPVNGFESGNPLSINYSLGLND